MIQKLKKKIIEKELETIIKKNEFYILRNKVYPKIIKPPKRLESISEFTSSTHASPYIIKQAMKYNLDKLINKHNETYQQAQASFENKRQKTKMTKELKQINLCKRAIIELKKENKI